MQGTLGASCYTPLAGTFCEDVQLSMIVRQEIHASLSVFTVMIPAVDTTKNEFSPPFFSTIKSRTSIYVLCFIPLQVILSDDQIVQSLNYNIHQGVTG